MGEGRYNRLVLSLINVRPGEFFTFENISRYLKFFYPNLAQVVLVSPLIDEKAFGSAAEIARIGYQSLVISPNPIDFQRNGIKKGTEIERMENWQRTSRTEDEKQISHNSESPARLSSTGGRAIRWIMSFRRT